MSLKLEVGKTYIDNCGDEIYILAKTSKGNYIGEFINDNYDVVLQYDEHGKLMKMGEYVMSTYDNIAKLKPRVIKVEKWINVYDDGSSVCHSDKEVAERHMNFPIAGFVKQIHVCEEIEITD